LHVVLVEPEYGGNVGLVARAAKNFGADGLVLVNPQCDPQGKAAFTRSVHAHDILEEAQKFDSLKEVRSEFKYLLGTTARTASDYNVNRSWKFPWEVELVEGMAVVFGRESSGLTNGELALCDAVAIVPTSPGYPTLNISHAVAVVLYEFSKREGERGVASREVRDKLAEFWGELLAELGYDEKLRVQETLFRRVVGKAQLNEREAHGLAGVLSRALKRIKS
jgi:tRNA/rRNA methyltransferase